MTRTTEIRVALSEVTVGYGGAPVLRDLTLAVGRGEVIALIGPNGSGKSTLLKSIAAQLALLGGTILINGEDLATRSPKQLARVMASMTMERADPSLYTCFEIAAAGRYPYTGRFGRLAEHDEECVETALRRVHAWELADRRFSEISDGQRQRVLLARALAQEPEILVLDEPTSFLDVRYKLELLSILRELADQDGVTVLLSIHEADLAEAVADRLFCILADGTVRCGTPEEVLTPARLTELYGTDHARIDGRFSDYLRYQLRQRSGRSVFRPPRGEAGRACAARWDRIAKPLHSLGKLEDAFIQIADVQKTADVMLKRRALVVFCADNGVVAEGVTQTGPEVTAIVAENLAAGRGNASLLCRQTDTALFAMDVGMLTEAPGVENRAIARGTGNIAREPAMTREQAERCLATGRQLAGELKAQGFQIAAVGEMGIGNTTTSAALASALLGLPPSLTVGRGAGLSDEGLQRKLAVVGQAIALQQPDAEDPVGALAGVGGFDIGAMAGFFLGGAEVGLPVVADGFISIVAALLATRIDPACRTAILASHLSREPGARAVAEALGMDPILRGDFSLGEGTGAVMLFPLLDMAAAVYGQMKTFEDMDIAAYQELSS